MKDWVGTRASGRVTQKAEVAMIKSHIEEARDRLRWCVRPIPCGSHRTSVANIYIGTTLRKSSSLYKFQVRFILYMAEG